MEDGHFSRGSEIITAEGSIVFLGNLDGDIETVVRTSHQFYPMPEDTDAAFYDYTDPANAAICAMGLE